MRLAEEYCPYCNNHIAIRFDDKLPHREATCPKCGRIVMLCSICPAARGGFPCDRNPNTMLCYMSKPDSKFGAQPQRPFKESPAYQSLTSVTMSLAGSKTHTSF